MKILPGIVIGVALACSSAVGAIAATSMPYELVRTLQRLQDRAITGTRSAADSQRLLMQHIAERMMSAGDKEWQDVRNVHSGISFVLSGGDTRALKSLLNYSKSLEEREMALLDGAVAFAEGRNKAALEHFDKVELFALPTALAGQVALAMSALLKDVDAKRSLKLLDKARLIMPGTLVDEAALRRSVDLVATREDRTGFEARVNEYFRRFNRSIYRRQFHKSVPTYTIALDYNGTPERMTGLGAALEPASRKVKAGIYLQIAKAAILKGQTSLTRHTAQKAQSLFPKDTRGELHAKIYLAAANVVTEQLDEAVQFLNNLNRKTLRPVEKGIAESALKLAAQLTAAPVAELEDPKTEVGQSEAEVETDGESDVAKDDVVARAQSLLKQVEELRAGKQ